jgi:predicted dehydrogenase
VPIQLPRAPLYNKELSFRVSRSYGPGRYDLEYEERGLDYPIGYVRWTEQRNLECVLDLQARGLLRLTDLIDEIVPVDEAARAYARLSGLAEQRPRGAIVLAYPEAEPTAAPTVPVSRARASESGRVRIGLVGPGGFAVRILVPALVVAGTQLEVVGGGSGPSAEAATRELGFARVAASAEAVIEDPSVDAVVIATRHGTHAGLAASALAAGKHVFCEKPLALDAEELAAVLEAANESPGILAVGFNRRFAPLFCRLRDFVADSGEPVTAGYRVSAGRLPADHWTHDLEQGGGRMIGEGCHFVDSLVALAGRPVVEVHAAGYGAGGTPARARDNLIVSLTFADGSVGAVTYVAAGSPRVPKERLEAFSGERTAILDDYRTLELFGSGGPERTRLRAQDKGHRAEIQAFVDGLRRGEAPVALTEIENVHRATFGAVESLRSAQAIRLG